MRLRFGQFLIDTGSRQLRHGESERHLSPKAFDLLCLLLENRPRALSKAEIHERLWPATFVSDSTLTSLVAEVRAALGEHAQQGAFIRTVHRFGYAFAGTAMPIDERQAAAPPRCWIVWEWGQIALGPGEHLLGRAADVAVWLESPTVSRHHARLRVTEIDVTIEDLASKNGTILRGLPVSSAVPLADGDEIQLGSIVVKLRVVDSTATTATQAP